MKEMTSLAASVAFHERISIISSPAAWHFHDYFAPPVMGPYAEQVRDIGKLADNSGVENHPFFGFASSNRKAIEVWSAQEAVTTNAFSQLLLICCSHIGNVHARAAFMPVIGGEHHHIRAGIAERSHPWLLKTLCESLGLDLATIKPLPCTMQFLSLLADSVADPLIGLGTLGVGNERMLIPEYGAVRTVFEKVAPTASYSDFLGANITEDVTHTALLEGIAASLIRSPQDFEKYKNGARSGVEGRLQYYDALLEMLKSE